MPCPAVATAQHHASFSLCPFLLGLPHVHGDDRFDMRRAPAAANRAKACLSVVAPPSAENAGSGGGSSWQDHARPRPSVPDEAWLSPSWVLHRSIQHTHAVGFAEGPSRGDAASRTRLFPRAPRPPARDQTHELSRHRTVVPQVRSTWEQPAKPPQRKWRWDRPRYAENCLDARPRTGGPGNVRVETGVGSTENLRCGCAAMLPNSFRRHASSAHIIKYDYKWLASRMKTPA